MSAANRARLARDGRSSSRGTMSPSRRSRRSANGGRRRWRPMCSTRSRSSPRIGALLQRTGQVAGPDGALVPGRVVVEQRGDADRHPVPPVAPDRRRGQSEIDDALAGAEPRSSVASVTPALRSSITSSPPRTNARTSNVALKSRSARQCRSACRRRTTRRRSACTSHTSDSPRHARFPSRRRPGRCGTGRGRSRRFPVAWRSRAGRGRARPAWWAGATGTVPAARVACEHGVGRSREPDGVGVSGAA